MGAVTLISTIKRLYVHVVFVFLYAISLHYVWGILFLIRPESDQALSIKGLVYLTGNSTLLGIVLILVASLALISLAQPSSLRFGMAIAPQQFMLTLSAIGSVQQIFGLVKPSHGVYDPWIFVASQAPTILVALFHAMGILYIYSRGFPVFENPK